MEYIHTDSAPAAVGPYSQAVRAAGFVFTSGQIGLVPATGKLAGPGAREQARQAMSNLKNVLAAAGTDPKNVVEASIFLADMKDFPAVNEVYAAALGEHRPARVSVQAAGLPLGALVEIKMTALAAGRD